MWKPLHFVGSSLKDLRTMPEDVQDAFGLALLDVQCGDWPSGARPFGEGAPRGVAKLIEDHDGNTYRVAFTVSFPKCVYVLHVFQKKSNRGIATPVVDVARIAVRFTMATHHYREHYRDENA